MWNEVVNGQVRNNNVVVESKRFEDFTSTFSDPSS